MPPISRGELTTLGIDLASQARDTGVCLIEWGNNVGRVLDFDPGLLSDDVLVELMSDRRVAKVGIDAPFGWPLAFIDAVSSYRDTGRWLTLDANELRFRATEMAVFEETGQWPLTVAMSDLAWPAMRCGRLLSRLVPSDEVLDRSGKGVAAEVYPMAALRGWDIVAAGSAKDWSYKGEKPGRRDRRAEYMTTIRHRLGGTVELSEAFATACVDDDDQFDAFVSALVARAVQVEKVTPIPRGMQWLALREGWIHLPAENSLADLAA